MGARLEASNTMRTSLAHLVACAHPPDRARFVAFVAPAPRDAPERMLALERGGQLAAWVPDRAEVGGRAWHACARGAAVTFVADGHQRWRDLRDRADAAWPTIAEYRANGVVAPPVRAYGGAAFRPGAADQPPWCAFGDASFVVPRWECARAGDAAFARLVVGVDELHDRRALLDEIDDIAAALERDGALPTTAPSACAVIDDRDGESWRALVDRALHDIRARELDKVVAARRAYVAAGGAGDPIATFRALARDNASCTCFAFARDERAFVGASPERLVVLDGRAVATEALAGTSSREAGAAALLASDKDRREHALVVEHVARALAASCSAVRVAPEPAIRTLRAVHHLWTPIEAHAAPGTHVLDLVAALHPTPAVCGAPTRAASLWIEAHEPFARGWYAAPVGWFDRDGNGAFAVGIRSALVDRAGAWVFAGAGIVAGSDSAREYGETLLKQRTMLAALGASARAWPERAK